MMFSHALMHLQRCKLFPTITPKVLQKGYWEMGEIQL
jgi:hypothetical protein